MAVGVLGKWLLGCVHLVPLWFQETGQRTYLDSYRFVIEYNLSRESVPGWLYYVLNFRGVPDWIAAWPHLHGLLVSLAGIVVGGGVVWAVRWIGFWALKREAMGFGDVVLMAMIGSFVGWQPVLIVFFLAPICALVVAVIAWLVWREREIPYGPYLSLATLLMLLFWWKTWPHAQERIFGLGPFLPIVAVLMFCSLAMLLLMSRGMQRMLGIRDPNELAEVWESADQLFYQSGERTSLNVGQWQRTEWRGTLSGRGEAQNSEWRGQSPPQGRPPSLRFPR
jgi:leader peptidase (prepilin peptidase)/N-methyltransferase